MVKILQLGVGVVAFRYLPIGKLTLLVMANLWFGVLGIGQLCYCLSGKSLKRDWPIHWRAQESIILSFSKLNKKLTIFSKTYCTYDTLTSRILPVRDRNQSYCRWLSFCNISFFLVQLKLYSTLLLLQFQLFPPLLQRSWLNSPPCLVRFWEYIHYDNMGCRIFKGGIQIRKIFA